jgi:hypothetical protein
MVGEYAVDLLVEETAIVELKFVKTMVEIHRARCIGPSRGYCTP